MVKVRVVKPLVGNRKEVYREYDLFQVHLKAARINANMSKEELAEKVRLNERFIEVIENGEVDCPSAIRCKISEAIGIPFDFLAIP